MEINRFRSASLYVAIAVHYNIDGSIDFQAFKNHVYELISGGVDGLIIAGTTGEGHLLNWNEHLELFQFAVQHFKDQVILIGNVGSNSTKESREASKNAFNIGIDGVLLINPYYGKASEAGIIRHIEESMYYGPAMIYNVPSRTAQDIPTHVMEKLAQSKNFIGVKECSGLKKIDYYEKNGIPCWTGNDDEAYIARNQYHAHGVVSVAGNIIPNLMKQLLDKENHDELNHSLEPLFEKLFQEPNPIAIKTILMMLGQCQNVFKLPYLPLSKSLRLEIIDLIKELNIPEISNKIQNIEDKDFTII